MPKEPTDQEIEELRDMLRPMAEGAITTAAAFIDGIEAARSGDSVSLAESTQEVANGVTDLFLQMVRAGMLD